MTTQHILLTALGREQRNTVYESAWLYRRGATSAAGTVRLLPQVAKPNRVLALCTKLAKATTWPFLRMEYEPPRYRGRAVRYS